MERQPSDVPGVGARTDARPPGSDGALGRNGRSNRLVRRVSRRRSVGSTPATRAGPRVRSGTGRWAVRVLVAIGVVGFVALVQRLGGVSYFQRPRPRPPGHLGAWHLQVASLGVRFALLLWLATTPNPSRRRLILACAVVLLLTTGQRSAVFATLIPVVIVYHYRVRRLPAAHGGLVAVGAVVLAVSLIVYRQYTRVTATPHPAAATSTRQQLTSGSDIFRSALVSLDGLVLVQQAVPADQQPNLGRSLAARPRGLRPPHTCGPAKPPWRSNVLASRYLTAAHGGRVPVGLRHAVGDRPAARRGRGLADSGCARRLGLLPHAPLPRRRPGCWPTR